MKIYNRTENGVTSQVTVRVALDEVNHAMMEGKREVQTMSSGTGRHSIEYKDGRNVLLIETEEAPATEPREWHGTHSKFNHLHRFANDNRARCNRRIRANETPPVGSKGAWGVFKRTRSEVEADNATGVYTFCPRCEEK